MKIVKKQLKKGSTSKPKVICPLCGRIYYNCKCTYDKLDD